MDELKKQIAELKAEVVALKLKEGLAGPTGKDGADGKPGRDGSQGDAGVKGDKGDRGDDGKTGMVTIRVLGPDDKLVQEFSAVRSGSTVVVRAKEFEVKK